MQGKGFGSNDRKRPGHRADSQDVLVFYNYARRIDFQGTLKEFVHQTVILLFDTYARQKGIQLVLAEEID